MFPQVTQFVKSDIYVRILYVFFGRVMDGQMFPPLPGADQMTDFQQEHAGRGHCRLEIS